MREKFLINELTISGVKNIDKEITMKFSNSSLTKNYCKNKTNIKAIYGPNGAGKSGIISSMYIYKNIILSNDILSDFNFNSFVRETINKSKKKMEISIVFVDMLCEENVFKTIRHSLELSLTKNGNDVYISHEKIQVLKGNRIDSGIFDTVFESENGELLENDNEDFELIKESTMNLILRNSISNRRSLSKILSKKGKNDVLNTKAKALFEIHFFARELVVVLNDTDTHDKYFNDLVFLDSLEKEGIDSEEPQPSRMDYESIIPNTDRVKKDEWEDYKKYISGLEKFVQLFKPSLKCIEIEKKQYKDSYICRKHFNYGKYAVDLEFESTGIKKLVNLYVVLRMCANGKITFIDEMDANLHDVYFSKLIEFFKFDGAGQLCFTTHNLSPINILKDQKHSLEFLSKDSRIASWVGTGNSSPEKKYVNGLIEYSVFNIEYYDFDMLLI